VRSRWQRAGVEVDGEVHRQHRLEEDVEPRDPSGSNQPQAAGRVRDRPKGEAGRGLRSGFGLAQAAAAKRGKRPSVPSSDDIMFGGKRD
jgi:hypothetical protein